MSYKIELVDFSDFETQRQIVRLQNIVYKKKKSHFSIEQLGFWYLDNPLGNVISFNAFCNNEIVAHYACVPIRMKIGDKISNGLLDISTATHPEHRGNGLFKKLAQTTYDYAKNKGFEFIVGVANGNSFPGYMKYFDFTFVSRLDVKIGWGKILPSSSDKLYKVYWNKECLSWRLNKSIYSKDTISTYGIYNNIPFVNTFMGFCDRSMLSCIKIRKKSFFRPFNLYVGLGADLSKGHYFNLPKFVKHSPFNLIFLDLIGTLPPINKENIFFQLIDFDVA